MKMLHNSGISKAMINFFYVDDEEILGDDWMKTPLVFNTDDKVQAKDANTKVSNVTTLLLLLYSTLMIMYLLRMLILRLVV